MAVKTRPKGGAFNADAADSGAAGKDQNAGAAAMNRGIGRNKALMNTGEAADKYTDSGTGYGGGRRKGLGCIVAALIALAAVTFLFAAVVLNLFGLRERFIAPAISRVPIVGQGISHMLPGGGAATGTSVGPPATPASAADSVPYAELTRAQLIQRIDELTGEIEKLKDDNRQLQDADDVNLKTIERLSSVEQQQIQFKNDKADFDRMIALNDPKAYAEFYQRISPENADNLYKQALAQLQASKDQRDFIARFQNMDEGSAAGILEQMMTSDIKTVVMIMNGLDPAQSGAILAAMDPKNGAVVAAQMAPNIH